jgi:hypothetical protein
MITSFVIDPPSRLDIGHDGPTHAMVEQLILHSFQHHASRLEYRTIDGEFRVAQIIDGDACEYPQPPLCIRDATVDHLKEIFQLTADKWVGERVLQIAGSFATARCEISNDKLHATVLLVSDFASRVDLLKIMKRFWRKRAWKSGFIAIIQYNLTSVCWAIEEMANKRMQSSRRFDRY